MKIIMFQYNQAASAIIQMNSAVDEQRQGHQRLATNRFLANGYEDRLLWEEAANLKPKEPREYCIQGTWQ